MLLGNAEGIAIPSTAGASEPFPYEKVKNLGIRRLIENRLAMRSDRSLFAVPTWNDVVYAYVNTYHKGNGRVDPKLLFALNADRLSGMAAATPGGVASAGTVVEPVSGRTLTWSANAGAIKGTFTPETSAYGTVPSIGSGSVQANLLCLGDPGVTTSNVIAVKHTDANNMLRLYRTSTTNLRLERVVTGTPATEVDITVSNSVDPINYSAIGMRINGTAYSVFINGRKVASGTLSVAAQGLAGSNFAIMNQTDNRTGFGPVEVYSI